MNYWNEKKLVSSNKIKPIKQSPSSYKDEVTGARYEGFVGKHATLDAEPFIKVFMSNFDLIASLSSAGMKALLMIQWIIRDKRECSFLMIDRRAWEQYDEDMKRIGAVTRFNMNTFYRGVRELQEFDIIRKASREGEYQINPSVLFNGKREIAMRKEINLK